MPPTTVRAVTATLRTVMRPGEWAAFLVGEPPQGDVDEHEDGNPGHRHYGGVGGAAGLGAFAGGLSQSQIRTGEPQRESCPSRTIR